MANFIVAEIIDITDSEANLRTDIGSSEGVRTGGITYNAVVGAIKTTLPSIRECRGAGAGVKIGDSCGQGVAGSGIANDPTFSTSGARTRYGTIDKDGVGNLSFREGAVIGECQDIAQPKVGHGGSDSDRQTVGGNGKVSPTGDAVTGNLPLIVRFGQSRDTIGIIKARGRSEGVGNNCRSENAVDGW